MHNIKNCIVKRSRICTTPSDFNTSHHTESIKSWAYDRICSPLNNTSSNMLTWHGCKHSDILLNRRSKRQELDQPGSCHRQLSARQRISWKVLIQKICTLSVHSAINVSSVYTTFNATWEYTLARNHINAPTAHTNPSAKIISNHISKRTKNMH